MRIAKAVPEHSTTRTLLAHYSHTTRTLLAHYSHTTCTHTTRTLLAHYSHTTRTLLAHYSHRCSKGSNAKAKDGPIDAVPSFVFDRQPITGIGVPG
eukprot:1181924-Prorocentrum_minimum.AAC.2